MHVWKDRSVGQREAEGCRGVIELQWPNDSTVGEVVCWINSVPDLVFGGGAAPGDPKGPAAQTDLSECLFPAKTVTQTDSEAQRRTDLNCLHCMLIFSSGANALPIWERMH